MIFHYTPMWVIPTTSHSDVHIPAAIIDQESMSYTRNNILQEHYHNIYIPDICIPKCIHTAPTREEAQELTHPNLLLLYIYPKHTSQLLHLCTPNNTIPRIINTKDHIQIYIIILTTTTTHPVTFQQYLIITYVLLEVLLDTPTKQLTVTVPHGVAFTCNTHRYTQL